MRIAVYGKKFGENFKHTVHALFKRFSQTQTDVHIHECFVGQLTGIVSNLNDYPIFSSSEFTKDFDLVISIGGDGTMLESVGMVDGLGVPILGLNTGRLGFLSSVSAEKMNEALDHILQRNYTIEERSLLQLTSPEDLFDEENFALNELTVLKKDTASMITVDAYIDGKYMNSYWGDGLIISTPTGSTAYSLSCGGPILVPDAENFIITPIAPHNLNVRPVVLSNKSVIKLVVDGRDESYLVALDSRPERITPKTELTIKCAPFKAKFVALPNESFYETLRNKLLWGLDKRN